MSRHRAVRNLDLDDELYDDFGESTYDELQDISEEDEARLLEGVEAVKGVIGRSTGISDQEIKETLYYYYFDIDASVAWLQKEHKLNKKGEDIDRILANACHRHQKPKSRLRSLVDLARQTMAVSSGSSVATQGLSGLKALSQGSSSSNSSNNKPVSLKSLSSLGKSGSGSGGRSISLKSLSSLGGPPKPNPAASLAGSSVVGQALAALKPQSPQQQQGQQAPTAAAKAGLAKASLAGLLDKSSTPTLRNFAGRTLPSLRPITSPRTAADESLGAAAAGRTRASLAIDSLPIAPPTMYAAPSSLADFLLQDIRPTGQRTMAEDVVDQMQREIRAIMERNVKGNVVDSETMETNRRDVTFLTALVGKKEKAKKQPFAFDTPSPDDKVFAAQSKATNAPVAAGTEKKGNV